jgi:acetyltransferase-like isoleucine patch superfamily enzyme
MARSGSRMDALGKLIPALGWALNRLRHPSLHCGVMVELPPPDRILAGRDVRIGALTRIYLGASAHLTLGHGVGLGRDVHIQSEDGHIRIGEASGINDHARIYGSVSIGRYCAVGPNLMVASNTHVYASPEPWRLIGEQEVAHPLPEAEVRIGDDVWIGINVVIMPGITIGRGAVIGANSVVTKDVPPYAVAAGAPARVVRQRLVFMPPQMIEAAEAADAPYFYSGFAHRRLDTAKGYPFDRDFMLALAGPGSVLELVVNAPESTRFALGAVEAQVVDGRVRLAVDNIKGPFLAVSATTEGWIKAARLTD